MAFVIGPDGTRLAYSIVGDGPPLLLHLGAGCDSDLWRAAGYVDPLARSYRCILFDHRGHGQSDHPTGKGANHIDRYVDDVLALLDHLDIERPAFWGYSNGVAVGIRLADHISQPIRCLIGSGVIGRATGEQQLSKIVAQSVADYRAQGWEKLIAGFEADEGAVPDWMKERIRATDVAPVIGWAEDRLEWTWSAWDALPRMTTPTLFLVGELEDPADTMAEAAALMHHGKRVRVPGRGHINGFLDSDFVLPLVEAFLAET